MPDPSSLSLPPEERARMLAAMAGAIDGGFWTSPGGNSGGSPGEIAAAMLCALEPLLAEREARAAEVLSGERAYSQDRAKRLADAEAVARGLREALEWYGDESNYGPDDDPGVAIGGGTDPETGAFEVDEWEVDRGRRARAALSASPDADRDAELWSGEICKACGRPVAETCPTYWTTDDDLWSEVEGGPAGIRCIACFTRDAQARGIFLSWRAVRERVSVPEQEEGRLARHIERASANVRASDAYRHRAASSSEEGERVPAREWTLARVNTGSLAGEWRAYKSSETAQQLATFDCWEIVPVVAKADVVRWLRERLTSDEAVERLALELGGVWNREHLRGALAALADHLENRTESEGA